MPSAGVFRSRSVGAALATGGGLRVISGAAGAAGGNTGFAAGTIATGAVLIVFSTGSAGGLALVIFATGFSRADFAERAGGGRTVAVGWSAGGGALTTGGAEA